MRAPRTLEELPPWTEDQWLRIAKLLARGLEESQGTAQLPELPPPGRR